MAKARSKKPTASAAKSAKPAAKPSPAKKPVAKPTGRSSAPSAKASPLPPPPVSGDARRHVLSLSFLRDGDEFLARLETDAGQITEMKNRSLDQLLSLIAGELEDLLE
jgi:hypothetical protein